eukprot:833470-Pyramimonas_sp.AAC.1
MPCERAMPRARAMDAPRRRGRARRNWPDQNAIAFAASGSDAKRRVCAEAWGNAKHCACAHAHAQHTARPRCAIARNVHPPW